MVDINSLFDLAEFRDRLAEKIPGEEPVDVIVPLLHANPLWESNLLSFYREIPIRRMIVGDAGAIDGSVEVLAKFPRVHLLSHSNLATLGKSLAFLIEEVQTELFVYLQSDVFLPPGWFDSMLHTAKESDWIGCPQLNTVLIQYMKDYSSSRPSLPGAQLGRARYFKGIGARLEDDFVYRQEDFVLSEVVAQNGGKLGQNHETYHVHQLMRRKTKGYSLDITSVSIEAKSSDSEEHRVHRTQLYGFIKYCSPTSEEVVASAKDAYRAAGLAKVMTRKDVVAFAERENPAWLPTVRRFPRVWRFTLRTKLERAIRYLINKIA